MGWPSAFEIWWDLLEVEISMKTFLYMHIQSVLFEMFGFYYGHGTNITNFWPWLSQKMLDKCKVMDGFAIAISVKEYFHKTPCMYLEGASSI